ncbi:hypothetical protein KI387_016666, partial [Taxus chinensis]
KGPVGFANRQPQACENRLVLDPITDRVASVDEVADMDWCDRCFLPHPPCEEDQQFYEFDDDISMVGCSSSSQGGETSTKVISARTVATFWDYI